MDRLSNTIQSIGISCTGCGLCAVTCRHGAIEMRENEEGFLFPVVSKSKCRACDLCAKVCPVNSIKEADDNLSTYVARCKDVSLRAQSASGGLFGVMARHLVSQNGVVYGAAFVRDGSAVEHIRVSSMTDLPRILGSKYSQSYISKEIYDAIGKDIASGIRVLFSGTPCQISAIKTFVGSQCKNLFTVELICNSVPTPLLWRRCVEYIRLRVPFDECRMREPNGGKPFLIACRHSGSRKWKRFGLLTRFFSSMWFGGYAMRCSCFECRAKGHSGCDITIGDAWGLQAKIPNGLDGTGVSIALIHTETGRSLWQSISPHMITTSRVHLREVLIGNPYLLRSVNCAIDEGRRMKLMANLQKEHLRDSMGWFAKELELRFIDRVARKIRRIIRI